MDIAEVEEIYARYRQVQDIWVEETGLPSGYIPYLLKLMPMDKGALVGQLAREVGYSQQAAGKMVRTLCDEKLAEVTTPPWDARGRAVKLTAAGRRLIESVWDVPDAA